MSINFETLSGFAIPEGNVELITNSTGRVLWEAVKYMAILYSDGTLVFQNDYVADESHGTVINTYKILSRANYRSYSYVPWYSDRDSITSVYARDMIAPMSMSYWFYGCTNLTSIDLSNFDTSKVTNMNSMFELCTKLTSLDLSSFDTSNVTDMSFMFSTCNHLTSLDLSSFDTSNVTTMRYMFNICQMLTSLDVSNFNTSKVTDMAAMFSSDTGLTSLDLSNFDTSNVTDMHDMFYYCIGLTSLDLSSFDTSNVINSDDMFSRNEGTIYVANDDMVAWVQSTSNFPSTASVVVGSI